MKLTDQLIKRIPMYKFNTFRGRFASTLAWLEEEHGEKPFSDIDEIDTMLYLSVYEDIEDYYFTGLMCYIGKWDSGEPAYSAATYKSDSCDPNTNYAEHVKHTSMQGLGRWLLQYASLDVFSQIAFDPRFLGAFVDKELLTTFLKENTAIVSDEEIEQAVNSIINFHNNH